MLLVREVFDLAVAGPKLVVLIWMLIHFGIARHIRIRHRTSTGEPVRLSVLRSVVWRGLRPGCLGVCMHRHGKS